MSIHERRGGCACGAIRFKITALLMGVGVCHCTDCQKASGGAPNYVALAPKMAFEVTKGEAKVYTCKGDSGEDAVVRFALIVGRRYGVFQLTHRTRRLNWVPWMSIQI